VRAALEASQELEDHEPQDDHHGCNDNDDIERGLPPAEVEDAPIEEQGAELGASQRCEAQDIPCYLELRWMTVRLV